MFTRARQFGTAAALLLGSASLISGAQVTFQVNMGIQTALGSFNPAADVMEVRGSFNGWAAGITLTNSPGNTNVYSVVFDDASDAPDTALQYKYVINRLNPDTQAIALVWEGNVGVGMQNRAFTLAATDQTLPVAFFNNLSVDPGVGIPVTFRVNMALPTLAGTFNPGTDIVQVRGGFYNNWGPGLLMTKSTGNSNIYVATYNIKTLAPGATVPHKFTINDGGWEGGVDRTFVLANSAQSLPVVYYNRVNPVDPGSIAIRSLAGGKFSVSWSARAGVYLQSTSNLASGVWLDVPNSDNQGSLEFPIGSAPTFFRLASLSPP